MSNFRLLNSNDVTDHSAWASWIFRSRAAKNFTALGHRKKITALGRFAPLGRNFFLRSPWAVKFLSSLDRKIHDALAEWSVITHYCLIFSNLFSKFVVRNIHDEKLVKIATRAAMGFTPPVGRKSHCGPGSDFDEFFVRDIFV